MKDIVARLRPRAVARLTIAPPKPVNGGWLIRVRCHNPGRAGSFEATLAAQENANAPSQQRSWHVPWCHHAQCSPIEIPSRRSELLRLAIFRPNGADSEFDLLEAIDGPVVEIRHPLHAADGAVVTIRIRRGHGAVTERHVRLSRRVGDDRDLIPDVAFVSSRPTRSSPAHRSTPPAPPSLATVTSAPTPRHAATDARVEAATEESASLTGQSREHGGPYFFVHLQKTGGIALNFRLRRQFTRREMYPRETDGDPYTTTASVRRLVHEWSARSTEIRLIAGHFPLCTTDLLGSGFSTFTLLREPVERTLSFLRHRRALDPSLRDRPLEQIYEDPVPFRWLIHNHMVKMFALSTSDMTSGVYTVVDFTEAHLIRATEQLATVDVVGLQEHFEEFCAQLERRFGWRLGTPLQANQTKVEHVSAAFRARIAADNALDVELYQYALRLSASRLQSRSFS